MRRLQEITDQTERWAWGVHEGSQVRRLRQRGGVEVGWEQESGIVIEIDHDHAVIHWERYSSDLELRAMDDETRVSVCQIESEHRAYEQHLTAGPECALNIVRQPPFDLARKATRLTEQVASLDLKLYKGRRRRA